MDIHGYIPRPPLTQGVLFDGTEDNDLAEWCGADLTETDDGYTLEWDVWGTTRTVRAGDVIFRTKDGIGGTWNPFSVMNREDFDFAFMPTLPPEATPVEES